MKQFQTYCLIGTASDDFHLGIDYSPSGQTRLSCSFTAQKEHEVDAAIMALLHLRGLLRTNKFPVLPKERSLVAHSTGRA